MPPEPPPPPPGPVPIGATQANRLAPVIVTFDQPLVAGFSSKLNWAGVAVPNGFQTRYVDLLGKAAIAGAQVTCAPNLFALGVPPPRITYHAAPPDIVSAGTGIPAAAFTDFPVA